MTISTIILILTVAQCQARELISHALVAIFVNAQSAQNGSHADEPHKYNIFCQKSLRYSVYISESEECVSWQKINTVFSQTVNQ